MYKQNLSKNMYKQKSNYSEIMIIRIISIYSFQSLPKPRLLNRAVKEGFQKGNLLIWMTRHRTIDIE